VLAGHLPYGQARDVAGVLMHTPHFLGQYRVYKHEPNGEIQLATLEAASSRGRVDLKHMRSHIRHTYE